MIEWETNAERKTLFAETGDPALLCAFAATIYGLMASRGDYELKQEVRRTIGLHSGGQVCRLHATFDRVEDMRTVKSALPPPYGEEVATVQPAYVSENIHGILCVHYRTQPGDVTAEGAPLEKRDDWFVADCGEDDGAAERAAHVASALNAFGKPLPVKR